MSNTAHHHPKPHRFAKLNTFFEKPAFSKTYVICAGALLFVTTVFWSYLGSTVHLHNADQLSNSFLFDSYATFQQATLPGQHSFLFKWPLFFLIHLFGSTELAFSMMTVVVSLITVACLVYILTCIIRKPLVIGTIMLALASILLFVPAEAYPGALLPVNFAMIANRNLEYILYILALIQIIRTRGLLTWGNAAALLLLAFLIASDKLFMAMSLGGAGIALVIYLIQRRRASVYIALRWLGMTAIASLLAIGIIWAISASHLTTVANGTTATPYALSYRAKNLALSALYGTLGFLTNLGANPVGDVTVAKDLAGQLVQRLLSVNMIGYVVNGLVALTGIVLCYRLVKTDPRWRPDRRKKTFLFDTPMQLSQALIYTTIAALLVFVVSNHYYAVDARYLTIGLFAVFIALATALRRLAIQPTFYVAAGVVFLISIMIGMTVSWHTTEHSLTAQSDTTKRNILIVAALNQHHVNSLIGDYWRVYPIKVAIPQQTIIPLSSCTSIRDALSSKAWQQDYTKHSFAYILSLEPSVTTYPACSINQIIKVYGRASSSQLIAGTASKPKEILLFYDYGANHNTTPPVQSAITQPRTLSQLQNLQCDKPVIMNIVAHQDDDLLFINPELIHDIRDGDCIRSVYLTAGDAGFGQLYWLGREQGSEAAYAEMFGIPNPMWISRTIQVSQTSYATIATLSNSNRVSLIFLHLPDGNINGQGFRDTHYESLAKLHIGKIPHINAVDGESTYTSDQLVNTLVSLMTTYKPSEIHTQAPHNLSRRYPDHSDHLTVGAYAQLAYKQVAQDSSQLTIKYYIGYPERDRPENVSDEDLQDVDKAFFAYAHYDKGTCESTEACSKMSYIYYLNRQYEYIP